MKQSGISSGEPASPVRDVVTLSRREFDQIVDVLGLIADRLREKRVKTHGYLDPYEMTWVLDNFDDVVRLRELRLALERKQISL